jgi:hypothetical protein
MAARRELKVRYAQDAVCALVFVVGERLAELENSDIQTPICRAERHTKKTNR